MASEEIKMEDNGSLVSELIEENGYTVTQPDEDLPYRSLMSSMQDRLINLSYYTLYESHDWSIYKVPSRLRELNKDAYTPRIVSIGPFHAGHEKLQDMEVHKTRYMQSLIKRTTDPSVTFSECGKAILSMEEEARYCYYCEDDENLGSLAEILLVDGCFILELFLQCWDSTHENSTHDPIFGGASMTYNLQRDLALLENQIPFFILERLFELIMARIPKRHLSFYLLRECHQYPLSLNQLCASFFCSALNLKQDAAPENSKLCHGRRHLLDVIRNYYLPSYVKTEPKLNPKSKNNQSREFIHCVTQLREFGIKFVKGTSENLFDIKFSPKGVLEIPWLCIHNNTDSLLRNLIAFEQCCPKTSHQISSYAFLMDRLIDSPRDAELLQQKGIITNHLGSGEDVSELFNKICKEVFVEDFFFAAVCQQINEFSNLCWPKTREIFVRDYWSSPWKFIGVVAGSALLLLTVFQTGYTIAGYYPH